MSRQYDRRAAIVVSRDVPLLPIKAAYPIRISFKIEKQPYTPPNTADISITNLSEATRKSLQQTGSEVLLQAGYAADLPNLPILFSGQARTIDHIRRGSDWITRIQCGDGESAYRYAQVNQSWSPGTAMTKIASDIAQQIKTAGVDVSSFLAQLSSGSVKFPVPSTPSGFATQGGALQELDKILAVNGYAVSIQNGELQVLGAGTANAKQVIRIAADSGMIGSPEHGSPDKNGLPSILKVQALLIPRLGPGDPFIVEAAGVQGRYSAHRVVHSGDTHGQDWKTEIEAWPL